MANFFAPDLAIDLGSSTTRIFLRGEGLVVSEPSLIAVRHTGKRAGEVIAAGDAAKAMVGRVPEGVEVISPVLGGVITDFDRMDKMLRLAGQEKRVFSRLRRPRIFVAVPTDLTNVERRAVVESTLRAGGREVRLVSKLMAATVGLGVPERDSTGRFIVDFGHGTTEIGVVAASGMATSFIERAGSASLDAALKTFVRRKCNLLIGDDTAEQLKRHMGSASPTNDMCAVEVRGRSLITGKPGAAELNSEDVREALDASGSALVEKVCETLERTPPELAGDLVHRGLTLIGGGSMLEYLDLRLAEETGLPVTLAEDPRNVVIRGMGKIASAPESFGRLFA
ncbi:MAG: rod shape-determining protein [Myxococcota bacterium]